MRAAWTENLAERHNQPLPSLQYALETGDFLPASGNNFSGKQQGKCEYSLMIPVIMVGQWPVIFHSRRKTGLLNGKTTQAQQNT